MKILAIDPGVKTGVAQYNTDFPHLPYLEIVEGGLQGFQSWWEKNIDSGFISYDKLVVEDFTNREGVHGVDWTPLEIIHWLQATEQIDALQQPSFRKPGDMLSDKALKRANLYPRRGTVGDKHQVEALRHALAYLIAQRHIPTIALISPRG